MEVLVCRIIMSQPLYNAPQKLDRAIRCMVACERTEGGRLNAHSETARCSIQGKGSA